MPEQIIEGLKELETALLKLDIKTSGKVLRLSLREEAKPMFGLVKRKIPINEGRLFKSARLLSNVGKSKNAKYSARVRIVVGGKGTKNRESAGHVLPVEFGTSKRKATPFIRPSFDQKVQAYISGFSERLANNILKANK